MKIISWDIGETNLAYCILDSDNKQILKWNKIDILKDIRANQYQCLKCGKNAKYITQDKEYYCQVHKKQIENKKCDIKENKKKCGLKKCKKHNQKIFNFIELKKVELCDCYNKNKSKCKSKALYYHEKKYYCKRHGNESYNKYIHHKNASFYNKALLLIDCLKKDEDILKVDDVLIENQPGFGKPIMKSIQMMLFTYYLLNFNKEIKLINSGDKLKLYDGPEIKCDIDNKHKKNKFLGIKHCDYFLDKYKIEEKWKKFYDETKKKDDLADTFLQALTVC